MRRSTRRLWNVSSSFLARSARSSSSIKRTLRRLPNFRVPIFENKVVDHILEQASVKEKKVGVEELLNAGEDDEDA